ncbi:hypothetical protein [Roseomonas sp. KE0001]|uniref:hypothetical protein n=1 Tax=unclassified Roseomonas TaxID=2617492 RepID=UPI0018DF6079|nr:hypothetical protein [Roseomonas sp. KE0001]MBI0434156.1 hypothetical protein [Roseomonas sp. KE0001]
MARTPNYGLARADRNRSKQDKAEAKAQRREAERARRQAAIDAGLDPDLGEPVTLDAEDETSGREER